YYRVYAKINSISTTATQIEYCTNLFTEGNGSIPKLSNAVDIADFNDDGKMDILTSGTYYESNHFEFRTDIYENANQGIIKHIVISIIHMKLLILILMVMKIY